MPGEATAPPEALRLLTVPAPSTPLCSRDAIAKVLYALLFSWLITRVNALVSPQKDALSIAVLDIYGFEVGLRRAGSSAINCSGPSPFIISLHSPTSTSWGFRVPGSVGDTRDPRKDQTWALPLGCFQEGLGEVPVDRRWLLRIRLSKQSNERNSILHNMLLFTAGPTPSPWLGLISSPSGLSPEDPG